jgi:uncharacterized RDD family membrane protein YckC
MNTTATPPTMTGATVTYASFGSRLVAWIIDLIVIWCVQMIIATPVLTFLGFGLAAQVQDGGFQSDEDAIGWVITLISTMMATAVVMWVVALLYFALMESSKTQGSLGKMAMGIKVTDMDGQRVSFGKAFLRNIGKIVSQLILYIGYLMAAFTEKKQALHDIMASTLVLKK